MITMKKPTRQHPPLDLTAIGAALGLRGTCRIHLVRPVEEDVERPADRSEGALCVALSTTIGPYSDSPPRAILTVTHRASGLCLSEVTGMWLADKDGLRLAKAAAEILRAAPGIDWTLKDPTCGGDVKLLFSTLHDLIAANMPAPKPKRARKTPPAL